MSDFDGLDMAGGKSGLGSHSRLIRWLTAIAGNSQEKTLSPWLDGHRATLYQIEKYLQVPI